MLSFSTRRRSEVRVAAHAVIGADGVTSDVASATGMGLPPRVPILQAEVRLPSDWDPEVSQVWFDVRKTRFFFWLIPESPEVGVVGLVGDADVDTDIAAPCFAHTSGGNTPNETTHLLAGIRGVVKQHNALAARTPL